MRRWMLLLAVIAIAMAPAAALAAVNDTMHDVDLLPSGKGGYGGSPPATTGGTCEYCHLPHRALGARLWPSAPTTVATGPWLGNSQKATPKLCYSCHGTGSTYTGAVVARVFGTTAHKDNATVLTAWGEAGMSANGTTLGNERFVLDNGANLDCTSCHDVHSNTRRPFLKHYNTTPTAGDLSQNCAACHAARVNTTLRGASNTVAHGTGGGSSSQHPIRLSGSATSSFHTFDPQFNGAAVTAAGVAVSTSWVSGAKLEANSSIGCESCHAVHGLDNNDVPNALLAEDTYGPNGAGEFCVGCHNVNPGAAGNSHPANTLATVWGQTVTKPAQWPYGNSAGTNVLACETCHDAHYASPGTALWRRNGAPQDETAAALSTYSAYCSTCHSATSTTGFANHHPQGTSVQINPATGGNIRQNPTYETVTWNTYVRTTGGTAYAFPTDNGTYMTCVNCHFGEGGSTKAHNGFVSLKANTESELCVDCHSFNPSAYLTAARPTVSGSTARNSRGTNTHSHYVGAIATASYKKSLASDFASALVPKYSADGGGNGSIICESCHYWRATNQAATNWTNVTPTLTSASPVAQTVNGMIQAGGNSTNTTTANQYLCTACHGASPGGGGTHPTLPSVSAVASPDITGRVINVTFNPIIDNGVATLVSDLVNCDSCHRPHNAMTGSGALILEGQATTPNSGKTLFELSTGGAYLNQEGLCTRCHNR